MLVSSEKMKGNLLASIALIAPFLVFGPVGYAQAPDTLWTRTFGGEGNDYGHSVVITADGDYIIAGETYSFDSGSYDIYLIKINPNGDTLWTRKYGGVRSEYGHSVIQTSDSGYAIVGETRSFGAGSYDIYFIKTDSGGDTVWTRTYGGSDYEQGRWVYQTSDGGYIIAGITRSFGGGDDDVYLIRTDSIGDTVWTKTYGGSGDDWGNSVWQTQDGDFIVAGWTMSFGAGQSDVYLIKMDESGDTLWTATYGGAEDDIGLSVLQSSEDGFIVAGVTSSFGSGMLDVYLIKVDDSGDTLWTKTYGGSDDDMGWSVCQSSDGGYIIGGSTESFGAGSADVYIIETDSNGVMLWPGNYGGQGYDGALSVKQTSDGGYIIVGYTTSFGAGNYDVYIIRLHSGQTLIDENELTSESDDFILCSNYPNPFNISTTIRFILPEPNYVRLAVYDLLGREVAILIDEFRQAGNHGITFDASELNSGVYFYRLRVGDMTETRRMVLLK